MLAGLRALLQKQGEARPQIQGGQSAARQRQDRGALFEKKDVNRDGQLTRAEFLANQPDPAEAPRRFDRFDANRDGVLSRDEFIFQGNPVRP